ncbi:MAG: hypothetical protein J6U64_02985, partial [Alphaproteobacteria bacterium]|nr:hypothetical protein [Alphaproteobacteria bacterium]
KGTATRKTSLKSEGVVSKAEAVKVSEKKVVKMPKEEAIHIPVKTPVNVYKGLFWCCVFMILGMFVGVTYLYTEYQLVPREAVVVNVLKGEKPADVLEANNPAVGKKGYVKKARVFTPEEMQQILEEMRKSAELRKIKEKRAARRAQKAAGAKTEIKPLETSAE